MQIKEFNTLSLDDKVVKVNNTGSKLIESHPWYGRYKTNLYELEGIKVKVLVKSGENRVILAHALEDSELEALSDSVYWN